MEIYLSETIKIKDGWFPVEKSGSQLFRWTSTESSIYIERNMNGSAQEIILYCGNPTRDTKRMILIKGSRCEKEYHLKHGENIISFFAEELLGYNSGTVRLRVSEGYNDSRDDRIVGIFVLGIIDCDLDQDLKIKYENKFLALEEAYNGIIDIKSFPFNYTIDITNKCNLKCIMCPIRWPGINEEILEIRPEYARECANLFPYAIKIQLHGSGESTTSDVFWQLLQELRNYKCVSSEINTNGTLITQNRIKEILDSGISIINFSLDAATNKTYKKIRNYDFDKVINNIKLLSEEKSKRGLFEPVIHMNMTLMKENIEEIEGFVKLAFSIGAEKVWFYHLNFLNNEDAYKQYNFTKDNLIFDYKEQLPSNYPDIVFKNINKAIEYSKNKGDVEYDLNISNIMREYQISKSATCTVHNDIEMEREKKCSKQNIYVRSKEESIVEYSPKFETIKDCINPWIWCLVDFKGNVRPCCLARRSVGSLKDGYTLEEIWYGETMKSLRRSIVQGKIHPICQEAGCSYVQNQVKTGTLIFPSSMSGTRNFYFDDIWTNGEGIIEPTNCYLKPSHKYICINTMGYHLYVGNAGKIKLKIMINGKEMQFSHFKENTYYFLLDTTMQKIEEIKINSMTFVPAKFKINKNDTRELGIDVYSIEIE